MLSVYLEIGVTGMVDIEDNSWITALTLQSPGAVSVYANVLMRNIQFVRIVGFDHHEHLESCLRDNVAATTALIYMRH